MFDYFVELSAIQLEMDSMQAVVDNDIWTRDDAMFISRATDAELEQVVRMTKDRYERLSSEKYVTKRDQLLAEITEWRNKITKLNMR